MTIHASNADCGLVTDNLGADHSNGLTLGWVNLAWHNGGTGLVLGKRELSKTATGTRSKEADIVGNLHQGASESVKSTVEVD